MDINLIKYNRHWEKNFYYPYPKKRKAFFDILPHLKKRQIIEITGLRRVGKSTLIFQIINELKQNTPSVYHLLYYSFDENQPNIETLLEEYLSQTGVDYKKESVTFFLDEIQKLPNFQNQIKVYYDLYPNIKFIVSGSTSLFIRRKNQESLAGRTFSFIINPLDFNEYLMFREKEELLLKPRLYQSEIEKEFKIFLHSQFVESIFLPALTDKKEYFSSIIKKIIFEDLPLVFKLDSPQTIFRMAQFIAQKPGAIINNLHLAQELGISNKTVALYLSYLEDTFLIKKLYNFSRNLISSEKKLKKYYLASPSFSSSLVDFSDNGAIFENFIISITRPPYFYRNVYGHEVDFVYTLGNKQFIPVEVKFKKTIDNNDKKSLISFMNKFSVNNGQIIYLGIEKKRIKEKGKTIDIIPYFHFPYMR